MYCRGCQTVFEGDRCPVCGSGKGRAVQPEDICFLAEADGLQAGILEDIFRQESIPVLKKSTIGAGMAMKAGTMFERFRFYVRYEHLERAQKVMEEMFDA